MTSNTPAYTGTISRRFPLGQSRSWKFFGVLALLFFGSTALTVEWCKSMSAMDGMAMPGGWTMSMAWMRTPEQTWAGAAAAFLGMWTVMMVAMMLPSFAPILLRYREAVAAAGETRSNRLTFLFALGYFLLWSALGMAVFLAGTRLAAIEMHLPLLARSVPLATGVVVLIAGALQFTNAKVHHLACCREMPRPAWHAPEALHSGLRFGLHCCGASAGLTAILLVLGVMDLRAMGAITVAITAERLAPKEQRVARVIGGIVVAVGLYMIVRAA